MAANGSGISAKWHGMSAAAKTSNGGGENRNGGDVSASAA